MVANCVWLSGYMHTAYSPHKYEATMEWLTHRAFSLCFAWCPCKAIRTVQFNGGFLPDIILLTTCYFKRGNRLNSTNGFSLHSLGSNQNVLTTLRHFFYVPGELFWSLITRAKPAKILEPPLLGRRAARFATSSSLFSTYLVVISSDFNADFCVAHTAVRRW